MTSITPTKKHLINVAGGEIAVFQYGETTAKSMLAIHGITSNHLAWQHFTALAVSAGYSVYAPDLRGRAASNQLPEPFGMKAHAADMNAVIEQLQLTKPFVIGHSMGGFVAIALNHFYPGLIGNLVLIDGGLPLALPPGMDIEQVLPLVLGPALARLAMKFESEAAYVDYWRAHPAFADGITPEMENYIHHDLVGVAPELMPSTNPDCVSVDSVDLWQSDLIDNALKALDQDVVMLRAVRGLQNEPTGLYPELLLADLAAKYPKVEIITLADTNHYSILMSDAGASAIRAQIQL
jgi:pimeloyl-ACP methyl ester carboxylesterase